MITHKTNIRVTYPDTDQMGTVHHSNFAKYCEVARWELFRSIGISYKSVEEAGYMLPVIRMNFHFIKTTHYDELLNIETSLKEVKGARIWFTYIIYDSKGELVNRAETELAFVRRSTWKPCQIPEFIARVLEKA